MAKFTFKLEPLLRHRRNIEDQHQRTLAQLLREQMILENELRRNQRAISDDKATMTGSLVGQVDVGHIRRHAAHHGRIEMHVRSVAMRLHQLLQAVDKQRAELLEATRQRRAVELLRDKQYRRWAEQEAKKETQQVDELTQQAYARRMGHAMRRRHSAGAEEVAA